MRKSNIRIIVLWVELHTLGVDALQGKTQISSTPFLYVLDNFLKLMGLTL